MNMGRWIDELPASPRQGRCTLSRGCQAEARYRVTWQQRSLLQGDRIQARKACPGHTEDYARRYRVPMPDGRIQRPLRPEGPAAGVELRREPAKPAASVRTRYRRGARRAEERRLQRYLLPGMAASLALGRMRRRAREADPDRPRAELPESAGATSQETPPEAPGNPTESGENDDARSPSRPPARPWRPWHLVLVEGEGLPRQVMPLVQRGQYRAFGVRRVPKRGAELTIGGAPHRVRNVWPEGDAVRFSTAAL